ncbi:hypothetical protein LguiA_033933 [Lonicera macranthoides]
MAVYPGSLKGSWKYDAFLSFRGEDTRNNFTDHLYTALDRAGIYTFRDDERMEIGNEINWELVGAIDESRVSIVVFSENYASSTWCLDELALISQSIFSRSTIPVFYKVDPSDLPESLPSPSPSWGSLVRAPASRFLPDSISSLSSLRRLDLSDCNLSDGDIPIGLWSLSSLQRLCLAGNNIHSLPATASQLRKLEILSVDRCRSLQSLPEVPPKLVQLHANGCTSMEKLPNLSDANKYLHLYLMNCHRLAAIQGLENLSSGYSKLGETSDMYLTRRDIPDWFRHHSMGSSISFDIPPFHARKKFLGMTLWIVYEGSGDGPVMTHSPEAIIMNRTNGVELRHTFPLSYGTHNPGRHSWVCHIPVIYLGYPIIGGEKMEVSFEINHPLEVKHCGIHLVYKPNIEEDDQVQSSGVDGNVDSDGAIVDNMRPRRARIA